MLWYKDWLETRVLILFAIFFAVFPVALAAATRGNAATPTLPGAERSIRFLAFYWSLVPMMLAGSGVTTRAIYGAGKGLQYFTLSLPVSRFRLLTSRTALGLLEVAAILAIVPCAIWIMFPVMRAQLTTSSMLAHWGVVCLCCSSLYFLGVCFATIFDGRAQGLASMVAVVFLQWLFTNTPVPQSINIFRAMSEASPIVAHTIPWAPMGISLAVGAVLFCATAWIVQTREY